MGVPAVTTDERSYQASARYTKDLAVQGIFDVAYQAQAGQEGATALQTIATRVGTKWTWESLQVRLKVLVELEKGGPLGQQPA